MSEPYIGEIRLFGGSFAPAGWALCDGALLPISEHDALFNLIGTTYGGDGQTTFGLPDLRGRVPMHLGPGYAIGQMAGAESVTLTVNQIPAHTHAAQAASGPGTQSSPVGGVWAASSLNQYGPGATNPSIAMAADALSPAGGSQPHDNMMPFVGINFIISLYGVFPSQT